MLPFGGARDVRTQVRGCEMSSDRRKARWDQIARWPRCSGRMCVCLSEASFDASAGAGGSLVCRIACLFDMRPSLACDATLSTSRVISTKCTMWHSTRSRCWPSTKRGLSTPHMWKAKRAVQCSCLSATRRFGVGGPRSARDGSNPDVDEALRIGSSGSRFGDAARAERCRARGDLGPLGDDSSCRSVSERLSAGAPLVGAVRREVSKARGVGALTPGPASVGPGVRNRRPDRDHDEASDGLRFIARIGLVVSPVRW